MSASQTLAASQRGASWLISLIQPDGSLAGAASINDYYKAPFGLAVTGHNLEADRLLDYVARQYLTPEGDLDGAGCVWFDSFRVYPHSWLLMAALIRGRFEMAHSLLRVLEDFHDPGSGGFFAATEGRAQRRGQQEVMTTSLAALACLWAGRLDLAEAAGNWLRKLYESQPDLRRGLYFVWDSANGLVTDFPAEHARSYIVDAGKTYQRYYQYGISAAFLSSLSGALGEPGWLRLAQDFLRASEHCRDDVYRQPTSGKIGWGAAWTHRLTRDPRERGYAETVASGLGQLQSPDGWWSALNIYERTMAAQTTPGIDVTGEFVGLTACIGLVLASTEAQAEATGTAT